MALNIPPRPLHQPEERAPVSYEYTTTALTGATPHEGLADILNSFAADGWKLAAIADRTIVFERPVNGAAQAEWPQLLRRE